MIENPVLIHSQLVGMGKNNKNSIRGLVVAPSPRTANCAGSTLNKHNTGLTHTHHTSLAVVQTQHRTYTHSQHTALAVVQTQHRIYTHSTLRWQWCKHNTGLTRTAHCAGSSANTTQDLHTQHTMLAVV